MWLNTAERLTNFCSLFTGKEAVTFFTSRKLCLDVVNLRYFNNSLVDLLFCDLDSDFGGGT